MASQSDDTLGWLVIAGFVWWVLTSDNPPGWAEFFFWFLVGLGVLWVLSEFGAYGELQRWWRERKERRRHRTLQLDNVDSMSGHEFERYVASMLEEQGYSVDRKGGSGDLGADAIAERGGKRFVVQAKHRSPGNKIGPRTVRATIGARPKHSCDKAMVVTNRYFTQSAQEQAGRECALVDRSNIADWIRDKTA